MAVYIYGKLVIMRRFNSRAAHGRSRRWCQTGVRGDGGQHRKSSRCSRHVHSLCRRFGRQGSFQ